MSKNNAKQKSKKAFWIKNRSKIDNNVPSNYRPEQILDVF